MKLYIPEIGDKIKLSADWTFNLHSEWRNQKMIEYFGTSFDYKDKSFRPVTLSKGTVLTVDQIYIRQGAAEYSSITFYAHLPGAPTGKGSFGKPKNPRFWASLKDCNKIEFDIEEVVVPLKLFHSFHTPKEGESWNWGRSTDRPETEEWNGIISKVITAKSKIPVLKVKITSDVIWKSEKTSALFNFGNGGIRWDARLKNVKYTLYTLDDKEIGNWKTWASTKTNAKKYVEENKL